MSRVCMLILCHVADSCCGKFCVPGCLNRGLFWRPAPDPCSTLTRLSCARLLELLTDALPALLRVRGHADQDLLAPGSRGRRREHPVLSGTRWFLGGYQVGLARPLTDCLLVRGQVRVSPPPLSWAHDAAAENWRGLGARPPSLSVGDSFSAQSQARAASEGTPGAGFRQALLCVLVMLFIWPPVEIGWDAFPVF